MLGLAGGWGDGDGVEDGPVFVVAAFDESGGGVYGEGTAGAFWAAGDGEHVGVVNGVSEDGVRGGDADAVQRGYLAIVGGNVQEGFGNDPVFDFDTCGKNAAGGDAEALDALFDDPVVRGGDDPDLYASGAELGDEGEHLREDVFFDAGGEEGTGGCAHLGLAEAVVHLDHLAADIELGDVASFIAAVFGVDPVGGLTGDEAGFDSPVHKGGASVAGPEGAIAVEYSYGGGELEDSVVELFGGEVLRDGDGVRHGKAAFLRGVSGGLYRFSG